MTETSPVPWWKQKKSLVIAIAAGVLVSGVFCCGVTGVVVAIVVSNNRPDTRTFPDLMQHFEKNGINGKFFPTAAGMIGATEGGSYDGSDFSIELYGFENIDKAKSIEKTGITGQKCYRNGRFIFMVYRGEDKTLPVFRSF